jgi:putative drug exporter of the RND superfamily
VATYLYRLGRFAYRRRGWLALAWVLVLAAAGLGATTLSRPMSSSFSIPGTQSQQALDLLAQRMPQAGTGNASARVVFVAPTGGSVTDPRAAAAIRAAVARLAAMPKAADVTDPITTKAISRDGAVAYANVTYRVAAPDVTSSDRQALFAAGGSARSAGLRVEFGGDATQETVAQGGTEGIGLVVAAVVLVITFGSLLAAGLPMLTAIVGVGLGVLGIEIATGFFHLSATTLTLALMLGLAVAIDYALFIVSRYRHELLAGRDGEEAAGRAVGTAGSAVVFAGATVVIALAALSVVGIPFMTAMGLAAAGTVFGAVVIALTLLPALLGFLGPRVLGRASRDTEGDPLTASFGRRWAHGVIRLRVPVLLAGVLGLGVLAVPVLDLHLGMPGDATASPTTTQRRAYDALAQGFGPGFNGPLVITADLSRLPNPQDRAAAVKAIEADLAAVPGIVYTAPATLNPAGDTAIATIIPATGPLDTATADLVQALRTRAPAWHGRTGATVLVTGTTAVQIDISAKLRSALLPYLAVVVGLAFVLLTLVFRSLLVPLKATAGFLLSLAATFGVVVAVIQWGWLNQLIGVDTTGPVLSFLPIFLVGILFGLAMDYEVFLVTRMREEHVHGAGPLDSVVNGYAHGARVVTAAGIIMGSVFAGFIFSGDTVVKSMGLALAVGVLLDAFVVRMTLIPAVMSLLGDKAWRLPRWLDRLLPDVDVEGEKLTRVLAGQAGQADQADQAGQATDDEAHAPTGTEDLRPRGADPDDDPAARRQTPSADPGSIARVP